MRFGSLRPRTATPCPGGRRPGWTLLLGLVAIGVVSSGVLPAAAEGGTAEIGDVPVVVAALDMTPWTLPSMPPKCTTEQANRGDVAGCLLSERGDPPARGWGTPPFPDPIPGDVLPWVDVAEGATGSVVQQIQQALVNAGYSLTVDGQFGPRTATAVRSFQTAEGLTATGVVDSATADRLGVVRTGEIWPPPGWVWLGWAYTGSPALAEWEVRMASNASPIGALRAGRVTLQAAALPLYEAFLAEIQANGYDIATLGSYSFRCTSNAGKSCDGLTRTSLSNHAYGLAVDINSWLNPERTYYGVNGATACATPQVTDLPQWVVQTAEKWGLYWGGYGWSGGCATPAQSKSSILRDPMHFEFRGTFAQAIAIYAHNTGQVVDDRYERARRLGAG